MFPTRHSRLTRPSMHSPPIFHHFHLVQRDWPPRREAKRLENTRGKGEKSCLQQNAASYTKLSCPSPTGPVAQDMRSKK
eukprot:6202403-Pleurochrysis_carterae.AAC.2